MRGELSAGSLQLGILSSRLFRDQDVGVGVFPECEKICVGGESPHASSIGCRTLQGS